MRNFPKASLWNRLCAFRRDPLGFLSHLPQVSLWNRECADPDRPIAHVQFDPFDSPWRPRLPEHRRRSAAASAWSPPLEPAPAGPAALNIDTVDDLRAAVEAHERAILAHALGKHRWNQRQTARALGLTYDQLRHCIRKHALMEEQG